MLSRCRRSATTITKNVVTEYKDLIEATTENLELHLEGIDDRLQSLSTNSTAGSYEDVEQPQAQEERESTTRCLEIPRNSSSGGSSDGHVSVLAGEITTGTLEGCRNTPVKAKAQLENHFNVKSAQTHPSHVPGRHDGMHYTGTLDMQDISVTRSRRPR